MSSPVSDQIQQIQSAIQAQEALRPALGDATVDTVIGMLRGQLTSLQEQLRSAPTASTQGPPPLPDLEALVPEKLARKIRTEKKIEGARKQVTVMFADLTGFTALSETMDPEDLATLTNEVLRDLAAVVYEHEGYIDKFIGDSIMAVFGAPITHEDDPERALRAALTMRERLAAFNLRRDVLRGKQGLDVTSLDIHFGINTGLAVADNVGSDLRLAYTVMGDTVNTASRLESVSGPGQILVSRDTYRLTNYAFHFVALDPIAVKGKREPLPVFELVRAKLMPGKWRGVQGLESTFVGRERELEELAEVGNKLRDGDGSIIRITGEPGLGKSRLVAEFRSVSDSKIRFIEGRCFSHTSAVSYGPFLDLLRRLSGISDEDSESETVHRLDLLLNRYFPNDVVVHAVFRNILAIRLSDEDRRILSEMRKEEQRSRIFQCYRELLSHLASEQPICIQLEDVHWADAASIELIKNLLSLTEREPIVMVIVSRAHSENTVNLLESLDYALDQSSSGHLTRIVMHPLDDLLSSVMVTRLLRTPSFPETLRSKIIGKGDGNPFFIEEVLRSLIERGALMQQDDGSWAPTPLLENIIVPDTLNGVLMSRLDRLPAETKSLVQQASVIGRIFLYRILKKIAEEEIEFDDNLSHLEREEIIRERSRLPEIEYIFKHALTQEVAYSSLLTPRRKDLHRRCVEAMEKLFESRASEYTAILAHHAVFGEIWDKALDYSEAAGDNAGHLFANVEARQHYAAAITALKRLPESPARHRRHVSLLTKYVSVAFVADEPAKNIEKLHEARAILESLRSASSLDESDELLNARIYYWLGRESYYRGEIREAIGHFKHVLEVATRFDDKELLAIPGGAIGRALLFQGRFVQSEELLQQAIPGLERFVGGYELVVSIGFAGIDLAAQGKYFEGLRMGDRAAKLAKQFGTSTGLAVSHLCLAVMHLMAGDWISAVGESEIAEHLSEESGDRLFIYASHSICCWSQTRLGRSEAALKSVELRREVYTAIGGTLFLSDWFFSGEAEALLNAGQIDECVEIARATIETAEKTGALYGVGLCTRLLARAKFILEKSITPEIQELLEKSMTCFESGNAVVDLVRTNLIWADMAARTGYYDEARKRVSAARTLATSFDYESDLTTIAGCDVTAALSLEQTVNLGE